MAKFKIIIVGGGPVGLTTAHALSLAGIDFVVLEQRESIILDMGASLVLGPNSLRVMHQLGVLDALLNVSSEFKRQKLFTLDGHEFKHNTTTIQLWKKNHGSAPRLFYRTELIQTLYDSLPDDAKRKFLTGKKVIDIASDDNGVTVTCSDDIKYQGSIVLGADGAYSETRQIIRKQALAADPEAKWDPEMPYTATYRGLWCSFPRPSEPGEAFETQHKDRSLVYFTSHDRGWLFMFEKLRQKTKEYVRYTDKDIQACADRFSEFPINESLKVKDVFSQRSAVYMANLDEGVVRHWSRGRVALMGDACHKFTPNAGLGFNNGIQDIVALCNRLKRAVTECPNGNPDLATLNKLFKEYQRERLSALRSHTFVSVLLPRVNTWSNIPSYILARYIMPSKKFEYFTLKYLVSRYIKKGCILDYISTEEPFQSRVKWDHSLSFTKKRA